jgi:hypothetical protein
MWVREQCCISVCRRLEETFRSYSYSSVLVVIVYIFFPIVNCSLPYPDLAQPRDSYDQYRTLCMSKGQADPPGLAVFCRHFPSGSCPRQHGRSATLISTDKYTLYNWLPEFYHYLNPSACNCRSAKAFVGRNSRVGMVWVGIWKQRGIRGGVMCGKEQ